MYLAGRSRLLSEPPFTDVSYAGRPLIQGESQRTTGLTAVCRTHSVGEDALKCP